MTGTTQAPGQLQVLLVRHGQTALNAEGRIRGRADPDLDPVGIRQARATARALAAYAVGRVITSPLHRAVQTGGFIAEAAGVPQSVDPAYLDRDYARWTGHLRAEVIEQFGTIDAAPGVEPTADILARARAALESLTDPAPVAIVTHDAVIRPLLTLFRPGIDPVVPTCSWAVVERGPAGWVLLSFDNTAD